MTAEDERALRDELERVQHANKLLRGELAELKAFSVEELLERIHELEAQNAELRRRLERADEVRETWDKRRAQLTLELETAGLFGTALRPSDAHRPPPKLSASS
ncbi:MAG: hypothetical protein AB1730_27780 [Myxococcota bacterium]|jgi:predicted nuclease with TOPRIM domain